MKSRNKRYVFRKLKTRKKIFGTSDRPRLSVYRSLKHVYAQIINDLDGKTLVAASSKEKDVPKDAGIKQAVLVGENISKRAKKKGIEKVVFDRGGRGYHGRVKAVAEGARQGGLKF